MARQSTAPGGVKKMGRQMFGCPACALGLLLVGCGVDLELSGLGHVAGLKATRTVCAGTGDHGSLSDAVDAASDGDVIAVCPGTYTEDLDLDGRILTLVSADGADVTTVQGSGSGPVIDVDDASVITLEGFTIRGGDGGSKGGGVHCDGATLVLTANRIHDNTSERGGGLYSRRCALTATGNALWDNAADERGGSVYLYEDSGSFRENSVEGSTANKGGGGYLNRSLVVLSDNTWSGNHAGRYGGGLYANGAPQIVGDRFDDNTSDRNGGGVYLDKTTGGLFDGNVLGGNEADRDGGGLYARSPQLDLTDNTFHDNVADDDAGGALVHGGSGSFRGNTVRDNVADDDGGGVEACHGATAFADNLFQGNVAGGDGGGLALDSEGGELAGDTFTDNAADGGGGVHAADNDGPQTFEDVTFSGNTASEDGAGLELEKNDHPVTVRRAVFSDNVAGDDGGAISVTKDAGLILENALLVWNSALDDGAGIYLREDSTATLTNVVVSHNDSPNSPGIDSDNCAGVAVVNSVFSHNTGGDAVKFRNVMAEEFAWNDVWGNDEDYGWAFGERTGVDGNVAVDPGFADPSGLDYSLAPTSALIDAGDPSLSDPDGTRSDVGAYGGPGGGW